MRNALIRKFDEALKHKHDTLSALATSGKKVIGYFCTYTPVEVIHAAGFVPVRVTGGPQQLSRVDEYVPSFTCPYLRSAFETGIHGRLDYLSGMVQGYTCDVACGLINIWKENIGGEMVHTVPLPYNLNEESRKYFRSALEELNEKFQTIGGEPIHGNIENSVALYDSIRTTMMRLYEKRYLNQLPLSGGEFLTVIQAGYSMTPEAYLALLQQLSADIEHTDHPTRSGTPVLISGSLVEDPSYMDMIEASGGRIAGDDLCTGLRQFDQPGVDPHDPIDRIIDRHFTRLPCPARSRGIERARLLNALIKKSGAKGLIFLFQKFCTPHLADYPVIKDALDKEGVQSILLEMDETGEMEGQFQTRLEGFFEVLEGV